MRVLSFVILCGVLAACGADPMGSGVPDGSTAIVTPDGGDPFPVPHPAPPEVVSEGGPVLAEPRIVLPKCCVHGVDVRLLHLPQPSDGVPAQQGLKGIVSITRQR